MDFFFLLIFDLELEEVVFFWFIYYLIKLKYII